MVTARPTHFIPGASGRAPSIWALGHPMTHNPSTKACVESEPNFSKTSSEMVPPLAGPVANVARSVVVAVLLRKAVVVVRATRRKEDDHIMNEDI